MTFGEITSLVHNASEADNMLGVIPRMVNQAIHDIATMRSWRWMADTITLAPAPGEYLVNLPANFKEPQRGTDALRAVDTSAEGFEPWRLVSKQELLRLQKIGVNTAERKACIEETGQGTYRLRIGGVSTVPANEVVSFELDCYLFPNDLSNPTDSNHFTTDAANMVVQRALWLTLGFVRGKRQERIETNEIFAAEYARCAGDDAARRVAGRTFRMGGI